LIRGRREHDTNGRREINAEPGRWSRRCRWGRAGEGEDLGTKNRRAQGRDASRRERKQKSTTRVKGGLFVRGKGSVRGLTEVAPRVGGFESWGTTAREDKGNIIKKTDKEANKGERAGSG